MTRPIHLLVFPTRASKINGTRSHWALFIPYTTDSSVGKLIQVLGTPFTGYGLEFKRNYNLASSLRNSRKFSWERWLRNGSKLRTMRQEMEKQQRT
jgi:hypothetical protein